jgi:hypothetical protein
MGKKFLPFWMALAVYTDNATLKSHSSGFSSFNLENSVKNHNII